MGRAPCCDKANVKKGPWSPEEDSKLRDYIEKNGTGGNWIALPQKAGLRRCGKSCRLRWLNYLRPNIKHGEFSEEEDRIICSLYATIGSRWSIIAAQLSGRTDNDVKNYWNTKLKKKLMAFAAASSTSNSFTATSYRRSTTTKPSGSSQLNSLCNYNNFSSTPSTNPTSNTGKTYMTQPFSCYPVTSSNTTTCLSLFQNQMQNPSHQYYQPLVFGSDNQQTRCSSNNSDNGGSCGNINPDMGSFQNFSNISSNNNNVVVPRGFDEQEDKRSAFMLNVYDQNSVFLSQFDNMNSSTDPPPLLDFYDMDQGGDIKQLNMNINDLSLINIGDTQTQQVISSKLASQDTKDKDQRMMMYYFSNNYC